MDRQRGSKRSRDRLDEAASSLGLPKLPEAPKVPPEMINLLLQLGDNPWMDVSL